jgi:hypothetical protein
MAYINLNGVALATESGGTVTVDSATVIPAAGVTGTIGSGVTFPSNHIIQIEQTVKTSRFVIAGNTSEQLVTGYNCAITPVKPSSKILVHYAFDTSASSTLTARSYMERDIAGGGYSNLTGIHGDDPGGTLGDPSLSHGGAYANWMCYRQAGIYLDSPSYTLTNAITYRIGVQTESAGVPIYVGSTQRDSTGYHPRTASILILMEVAQ